MGYYRSSDGHPADSYVSIALLTMPDEVLSLQTPVSITVHWLHETYLDDVLLCRMSKTEDGSYLHTLTNSKGLVACELMTKWQTQSENVASQKNTAWFIVSLTPRFL